MQATTAAATERFHDDHAIKQPTIIKTPTMTNCPTAIAKSSKPPAARITLIFNRRYVRSFHRSPQIKIAAGFGNQYPAVLTQAIEQCFLLCLPIRWRQQIRVRVSARNDFVLPMRGVVHSTATGQRKKTGSNYQQLPGLCFHKLVEGGQ